MTFDPRFFPSSVSYGGHLPVPFDRPSYGETHVVHLEIVAVCSSCGQLESVDLICQNSQHDPIPPTSTSSSQPHLHHSVQRTAPALTTTNLAYRPAAGPSTGPSFPPVPPMTYTRQIVTNSSPTIPQFSPARSAPADSNVIPLTVSNTSNLPYMYQYPETHQPGLQQQAPEQHWQSHQYPPTQIQSSANTIQGLRAPPQAMEGAQLVNFPMHNALEQGNF